LNYDSLTDMVIGSPGSYTNKGTVYTVMGKSTAWAAANNLSAIYRSKMDAAASDRGGEAVAVGDVNGDYIPDLIAGMPGNGATMPGYVSVMTGKTLGWGWGNFFLLNGANGYLLKGVTNGDRFGAAIALADVDGNYVKDIIIGAPGYNSGAGAVYVYFGNTSKKGPTRGMATLTAYSGVRLNGVAAGDAAGTSVAGADLNSDGYGDVIVGAPGAAPGGRVGAGSTYIVFGQASWPATFNLSAVNGTNGFMLNGSTAGDASGSSLAFGDLDGDYIADLVVGAPLADYAFANAGAVYIFYGQRKPTPWTASIDLNSM
jgi:hypothetical protein